MSIKPLIQPVINLNGTSRDDLLEQQLDVLQALRLLQAAMQMAAPNGRDFQTAPEGTFARARDAWASRQTVVNMLFKEINAHAEAISNQRERGH